MANATLQRYIWFFDTLWRYKRITRAEIDKLWLASDLSGGKPLTRRTFYNYREGAEKLFDVNIVCDPVTYEYYVEQVNPEDNDLMRRQLFDSLSVNYVMRHSADLAQRILPEEIPSGDNFLAAIIGAMKESRVMRMIYQAFWKNEPQRVELEPYFVKAFRKRWYVIGYNRTDRKTKTYALDRIQEVQLTTELYEMPANFEPKEYFAPCFGVIRSDEAAEPIRLRTSMRQAQYLRTLPLHKSQREYEVCDGYVDFIYNMNITYDLVQEILSMGREVEVISPQRLRDELCDRLQAALDIYK